MNQVRPPKVRVALIGFVLASVFHATPVLGAILTRQEFSGDFTLVDASPFLTNFLPETSEYSGFVVYAENGTLSDWELNVNNLDLNLNPGSTLGSLTPNVNFDLSSGSNWNLVVDFGIAFDAPRYSLQRTSASEISFTGELGLAGGYIYKDPTANITLSSSNTSIPEPTSLLGLLFGVGGIAVSRKAGETKA
ncbi:PEP-CTERM sorting domain-containing protein [Desmonostoc muscorum LEGE 12446]|uniref:PEP-CTERM sorting domain-containing protein n=1 Tax=Desmonostoc muscorum LEGE 12446 TaxID=1828758 RepID=A0A8J6ZM01_DESMC|nr:PEP-CTERM sorting domain-containing protein [Desmonostoc muscorum]MCF2148147.1 PEP-CTERM sorting domain-containing protein [Desmonostoc muscorum LEGE 12446]